VNTYKATSDRGKAIYGDETFEAEFTALDERDELEGGHLVIVPRPYRVLVNNYDAGKQGEVVDLALRVDQERALVGGGIVARADSKPTKTPRTKGK
jgi:hypothetical protein